MLKIFLEISRKMEKITSAQLAELINLDKLTSDQIDELRNDPRSTISKLIKKWDKLQLEKARVQTLYHYEFQLKKKGINFIAGVDEAGRGPLAGPVVVASVILPLGIHIPYINDSKKLSQNRRETIYQFILDHAIKIKRAVISEKVIDEINIYQATIQGMYQVIDELQPQVEAVLIDAVKLDKLAVPSISIIKGDALSASIAAASIVAKVERDRLMDQIDKKYPMYGFAKNKGYGTAELIQAIQTYGACEFHRRTFEPIKSLEVSNQCR